MEFSLQLKEAVWQRQNGMCGISGKKFDELLHEDVEYHFRYVKPIENGGAESIDNCVMLWNQYKDYIDTPGDDSIDMELKRYHFPYANFENYSYDDMHTDIKDDVNICSVKSKELDDTDKAINFVKDTIQNLKSLKLEREHREELSELLRGTLEELNVKKAREKEIEEEQKKENYSRLKEVVQKAVSFIDETDDYKTARENLINAQNELKDNPLKKDHREELFNLLNSAFRVLNEKQSAEREDYEMECIENYHNIKAKVDEALARIDNTEDLRESRKILIETQGFFKGLKLKKEQREEQYARIQDAFDVINKQQEQERKKYEQECDYNYDKLKNVVGEAIEFSKKSTFFKDGRERLISAQGQIKEKKLKKDQRDELFAAIRAAFDDINRRQDEEREHFDEESEENYKEMRPIVDEVIEFSKKATYFKEAREKLIELQNQLKEKMIKRELKDEMFSDIRTAFEALNERQDKERAEFEKESEENYKILKVNVDEAINFANNTEDFGQARQNLISAQQTIKGMKLKRSHRDELYGAIRKCFNKLNERSEAERAEFEKESLENYNGLLPKIEKAAQEAEINDDFRQIRENLIALQNEVKILKLKRKHRNDLFERIRNAFSAFDDRQDNFREETKQERQEKLVLIMANLKEKKERIQDSIERDKNILNEINENIENEQDEVKAERLKFESKGKISSIERRIKDKESSIEEVENRIEEIQKELRGE